MQPLSILIADDHVLVTQGVRKILEEQPGWRVVAQATNGRDAVRLGADLKPDVAVIDISMPQLNGVEATAQLTAETPATKILMLSMHADDILIGRALRAGARGYLLKDSADVDLVRAVAAVAAGESFFSPPIAHRMVTDYMDRLTTKGAADPLERLSPREREVFQLVAEGHTNREISELLSIRPATVETHRAHILQKLELHSTAELVRYAVQRGVIS